MSVLELDELAPPAALDLATLASPAVQLEPRLLRELRLALFPRHGPELEADLWFSPLVAARSPRGVVFGEQARDALRRRLEEMLASEEGTRRARRAWRSIHARHGSLPPALALEEQVAWLVVSGARESAIEDALAPALAALESGGRSNLARWAGFAWARLPESARATGAGWLLGNVGGGVTSRPRLRPSSGPRGLAGLDIGTVLAGAPAVRLAVRRQGDVLEAGAILPEGAVAILVPDTEPRILELRSEGGSWIELELPVDGRAVARIGSGEISIRTLVGEVYQLAPEGAPGALEARRLLAGALVEVGERDRAALGFLVEPDRVLTVASVVREAGSGREEAWPAPVRRDDVVLEGALESRTEELALLFVERPLGNPLTLSHVQPPSQTEPWVAAASARPLRLVSQSTPRLLPAPGGPLLAGGVPIGIVTSSHGVLTADAAAQFVQAAQLERPRRDVRGYAQCAQAVALWYHVRLGQLLESDEEDLLRGAGAENGLSDEQTDHLRARAEYMIEATVEEALTPGWAPPDPLLEFTSATPDTPFSVLGSATANAVARTLEDRGEQRIEILRYSREAEVLRQLRAVLLETGIESENGDSELTGTAAAFARVLRQLGKELDELAPAYDTWDEREALPPLAEEADDRLAEILLLVDELTARTISVRVVPWRVLTSRVRPRWREERDRLVALRIPDASSELDIVGFLGIYVDHVRRILDWLTGPLGSRIGENGFGFGAYALNLVRQHAPTLARRLEPNRRLDSAEALLSGPFEAHVELYSWSAARLLEQLRSAMPPAPAPASTRTTAVA
jgi:hypothetical protein